MRWQMLPTGTQTLFLTVKPALSTEKKGMVNKNLNKNAGND